MAVATVNKMNQEQQANANMERATEILCDNMDLIFQGLCEAAVNPYKHLLRITINNWTDEIIDEIALRADFGADGLIPRRAKYTKFNQCKYGILDGMKFLGLLPCSREENWYHGYTQESNHLFQKYNPQYTDPTLTIEQQPGYNPNPLGLFQ